MSDVDRGNIDDDHRPGRWYEASLLAALDEGVLTLYPESP